MTTLNLWQDPFADVEQLVRTVFGSQPDRPQGWTPASEVFRDGDDALVQVEVPGLDPTRDVTVEIERGHLVIRGERRQQSQTATRRAAVGERRYGSFRRVFRLPDHVGPEALTATYDAGILTVRVAGAYAPPAPVKVAISTGGPAPVDTTAGAPSPEPVERAAGSAEAGAAGTGSVETGAAKGGGALAGTAG